MIKRKNILKIAIDSPAAAGAGTLAKSISKHYNLFYLDTGKIYRFIAYNKIKNPKKFNLIFEKIDRSKLFVFNDIKISLIDNLIVIIIYLLIYLFF